MTFREKIILIPRAASLVVGSISLISIICWVVSAGHPVSFIKDFKFNSSLCLFLTSVVIWVMKDSPRGWNKKLITLAQGLCLLSIFITTVTLVQYILGVSFGIDELIVSDHTSPNSIHPGRISPSTTLSLFLLNVGLLILDHKPKRWRRFVSSTFLIPGAIIPMFAAIGYTYGEQAFYQFLPDIKMSWITSGCLLILYLGALFCRPKEGPIHVLTAEAIGGIAARRLLPIVFILPFLTGFVVLYLVRSGSLDFQLGLGLLTGILIIVLMSVIIYTSSKLNDLDKERLLLIDELSTSVKAREELLSIASHEMKTPITVLQLQTQMMQKLFQTITPDERTTKFVIQVEQQSKKLSRLIDDMLDVSRIRSGTLILQKEKLNSCELVQEVVARMKPIFEKSGSGIPKIIGCEHATACWDRMRIEQVLNNLFTNAIRYGEGKPILVEILDKGEKVQMIVQDSGVGIPEDKQHLIFDRFERAGMTKESLGLGLGLYITKKIVEAHHGNIWVESKPGKGSTFFVELPKNLAVS